MKVLNKNSFCIENAEKVQCPNCKGFGRNFGEEECSVCCGWGEIWKSKTSDWIRSKYKGINQSKLY